MKKLKYLLLLCMMTFLLTGCVKYNATMDIKKDKSMDFSIIYALNSQLFGDQDILDDDEVKELEEKGFSVTSYSEDSMKGYKISKSIKNIDSVSSTEDTEYSLSGILEDDDSYVFKVQKGFLKNKYIAKFIFDASDSDLSDESSDSSSDWSDDTNDTESYWSDDEDEDSYSSIWDDDNELDDDSSTDSDFDFSSISNMDLSFNVTLPYSAISNNASTTNNDNKSLSWNLSSNQEDAIEFEFELYNMTNIYIGMGVIVLILIIVILFIYKSKRRKRNVSSVPSFNNQNMEPIEVLDSDFQTPINLNQNN
jgi:hypothetical protein